jgi:hypothetical protein
MDYPLILTKHVAFRHLHVSLALSSENKNQNRFKYACHEHALLTSRVSVTMKRRQHDDDRQHYLMARWRRLQLIKQPIASVISQNI